MKIVMIGYHCCIRLSKQALALIPRHEVHCIGFKPPSGVAEFSTFTHVHDREQLINAIRLHRDADVFHVHNEPNWFVPIIKQLFDKPVVLDLHDSMAYRSDDLPHINAPMERVAVDMADALVFVSEGCRKITFKTHKVKKNIVLYPYVNERFHVESECSWAGGIVYEGLVSTDTDRKVMQYANYTKLAKELQQEGIVFNIYNPRTGEEAFLKQYNEIVFLKKSERYDNLIKVLGQYDWGLIGNIDVYKDWQVAMPNKLFEYMAAGIPIIAMNCSEAARFVTKHKVGIVVKDVQELKDKWMQRQACQRNVFLKRNAFTMENNIHKLEKLYGDITGNKELLRRQTTRLKDNRKKTSSNKQTQ